MQTQAKHITWTIENTAEQWKAAKANWKTVQLTSISVSIKGEKQAGRIQ